jgi:hypothetical protein
MRLSVPWLVLTILCLSARVSAEAGALEVTRGEAAAACPEAPALLERLARIRGTELPGGPYRVDFTREGEETTARIQLGAEGRTVRELRARGESCDALAQATAVALALLLDSQAALSQVPAAPLEPPPAAPLPRVEEHRLPAPDARRVTVALGGGVLVGALRPVMPAVEAAAELRAGRLGARLGALAGLPGRVALGPGEVRSWSVGGSARACFAVRDAALRTELCTGAIAGAAGAQADGYRRDERRVRPWVAIPVELGVARLAGRFGVELGAAALVPILRDDFAVEGLGPAYRSLPVSVLVAARASLPVAWR